jgi:hypothetical protein
MGEINVWAVLAAALTNFLIGGLWYSPAVAGKAWMRANDFTDADLKKGSQPVIFGVSFLFCLLMAANLAAFLFGLSFRDVEDLLAQRGVTVTYEAIRQW